MSTPLTQFSDLPDVESLIPAEDSRAILRLRLLIGRAANKDSLHWWEDDAYSDPARFILNRTFVGWPVVAARSLSIRAAAARHKDACIPGSLHLYHLDDDNLDRLILEFWPLLDIPVPETPITSLDALRQALLKETDQPMPYQVLRKSQNGGLMIKIPPAPKNKLPMLHRAETLAWAFLEGSPGQPAIPYAQE